MPTAASIWALGVKPEASNARRARLARAGRAIPRRESPRPELRGRREAAGSVHRRAPSASGICSRKFDAGTQCRPPDVWAACFVPLRLARWSLAPEEIRADVQV